MTPAVSSLSDTLPGHPLPNRDQLQLSSWHGHLLDHGYLLGWEVRAHRNPQCRLDLVCYCSNTWHVCYIWHTTLFGLSNLTFMSGLSLKELPCVERLLDGSSRLTSRLRRLASCWLHAPGDQSGHLPLRPSFPCRCPQRSGLPQIWLSVCVCWGLWKFFYS